MAAINITDSADWVGWEGVLGWGWGGEGGAGGGAWGRRAGFRNTAEINAIGPGNKKDKIYENYNFSQEHHVSDYLEMMLCSWSYIYTYLQWRTFQLEELVFWSFFFWASWQSFFEVILPSVVFGAICKFSSFSFFFSFLTGLQSGLLRYHSGCPWCKEASVPSHNQSEYIQALCPCSVWGPHTWSWWYPD